MLLFLVRHARSEVSKGYWQSPDSQLSEVGKEQALVLGRKSRFREVDKVFSSEWDRSKKTAEIISNKLGVDMEVLEFIHERKQSLDIYGSLRDSKVSKAYSKEYKKNYRDLDWKFAKGEESVREVLSRVGKLENYLIDNYKDKQVLVVSHDIFIRCFLGVALLGEGYLDESMVKVLRSLSVSHTGISLLKYDYQMKGWRIYYVNDISHFKEFKK